MIPKITLSRLGMLAIVGVASTSTDPSFQLWNAPALGSALASALGAPDGGARYNELPFPSVHNAYAAPASLPQQLEADGVRSLELDLHTHKRLRPRLTDDWYVYHVNFPFLNDTVCDRFTECLDQLAEFHRRHPGHLPVTVFLDMKDPFGDGHEPESLDDVIAARIPASAIVGPHELMRRCPGARDLREAVQSPCGWPTVGELRGKFVFALTGGTVCGRGDVLRSYAPGPGVAETRLAYIAPNVTDDCTYAALAATFPFVVFFNLDWAHRGAGKLIRGDGAISRIYEGGLLGGLDGPEILDALQRGLATVLVTDELSVAAAEKPGSVVPGRATDHRPAVAAFGAPTAGPSADPTSADPDGDATERPHG